MSAEGGGVVAGLVRGLSLAALFLLVGQPSSAQEPLRARIDKMIAESHIGPVAAVADDAEFLRRIYLDLTGTIPSAAEARQFLDDKSPDKRTALIDRLLNSPAFNRRMAVAFDIMLMERRGDKHVKSPEWQQYLLTSVQQNKPYNQLAAEILGADGVDPKLRAPAKFYLDRNAEVNLLTREVGRMFFGMDLECAQCHDHPLIDDYLQSDYYGLYAFVNRSYLFQPDKKKPAVLAEKAEGDVKFKSVFTGEEGKTRPRLPGSREIDEPAFKKGEEYRVKPNPKKKTVRPIPKYSRRAQLAKLATDGTNRAFNRNIANRLWAHMMGRGLVHPVDLHYAANPPAHPELLELLADEFVAMKFDVKAFLRELALTSTYQRSFRMPESLDEHVAKARQQLPGFQAELKQREAAVPPVQQAVNKIQSELDAAKKAAAPLNEELKKRNVALAAVRKTTDETTKAQAESQKQLTAKQDVAKPLAEAVLKIQEALKKLPGDKELALAAGKFQARSKQLADEVAALSKTVTERTAAAKAAAQKLAEAQKAATAITAKVNQAQQQVTGVTARITDADKKLTAAETAVKAAERRVRDAGLFIGFGDKLAAAEASRSAVAKGMTELTAARQGIAAATANAAKAKSEMASAQKVRSETAKTLAGANKQLADRREVAGLIAESLAKAALAAQKLPGDAELTQVITKLKVRSQQLTKDVGELQKKAAAQAAVDKTAAERLAVAAKSAETATAAVANLQKKVQTLDVQLKQATAKAQADRSAFELSAEELTEFWANRFAVTALEPLSPDQMAWSVMQATGQVIRQHAASAAEINKKTPLKPEEEKEAAKVAARNTQIEQAAYNKLKPSVANFVKLYGAGAGQPQHQFFATVDQALFFANGGEVRGWLSPGGGNLTDRLNKTEDPKVLAEELYLSVLTRLPTDTEAAAVADYLASQKDKKNTAVQELAWALLTSTEFRFNH